MKKTIRLLKLVPMLMSKSKVREFLLMVEVTMMIFLITFTLVPISNAMNLAAGIKKTTLHAGLIYGVPSPSNQDAMPVSEIKNVISSMCGTEPGVFLTESVFCNIQPFSGKGYLLLLSEDLCETLDLELESDLLLSEQSKYVPVVINSNLAQQYDIGDVMQCTADNGTTTLCMVSGILKRTGTVIAVQRQEGTKLTLGAIGFNMAEYDDGIMIAVSGSVSRENTDAAVFALPKDTPVDELVSTLNEMYSNRYQFHSFESLRNNAIEKSISDMDWRIVLLFLFAIVLVFNLLGYIFINTRQKQKLLSVMYICGMPFRKSLLLNTISVLFLVIPALFIGLSGSPFILAGMDIKYFGFNRFLAGAIAVIFVGAVCITVFASVWQRRHTDIVNLYKRGSQ